MSDSDHTAAGQALGYAYQFDRATFRLLEADANVVAVGIEHVEDVSVHRVDGTSVREQDKSTISNRRPLTDRSVALWKTLGIWSDSVATTPSILDLTDFHLVTNGEVLQASLAGRIGAAADEAEATEIAKELIEASLSLRGDLLPHGNKLSSINPELLAKLILRISVLDRVTVHVADLDRLSSLRYIGSLQRQAVFNNATAWVRRQVLKAAQGGLPTIIDREAFDREVRTLLRFASVAPFAVLFDTPASDLEATKYESSGFWRQLDWVDTDPDFVRDCVIHYAHARFARAKWAETDAISESSLLAYEEDLRFRWRLRATGQGGKTYSSEVARGQELLNQTLSEETSIEGQALPKAISCGSFHALADFDDSLSPLIGWHPNFKALAKNVGKPR